MEKLDKKYVKHSSSDAADDLLDDLMKKDILKMTVDGWKVHAVAASHEIDEARAVVVTFQRKKQPKLSDS